MISRKNGMRVEKKVKNEPSSLETILVSAAIPVGNSHPTHRTRKKLGPPSKWKNYVRIRIGIEGTVARPPTPSNMLGTRKKGDRPGPKDKNG